ncbi:hypothetical protein BDR26DRAFT_212324 [Obelidium mucronatum]|nr:hypothetical protein BDR26DRAFT_212324 [Obelidium mucronatum]
MVMEGELKEVVKMLSPNAESFPNRQRSVVDLNPADPELAEELFGNEEDEIVTGKRPREEDIEEQEPEEPALEESDWNSGESEAENYQSEGDADDDSDDEFGAVEEEEEDTMKVIPNPPRKKPKLVIKPRPFGPNSAVPTGPSLDDASRAPPRQPPPSTTEKPIVSQHQRSFDAKQFAVAINKTSAPPVKKNPSVFNRLSKALSKLKKK